MKKPADLTEDQQCTPSTVKTASGPLFRAYPIKEQLRAVFTAGSQDGRDLSGGAISWARRSRIPEMIDLAPKNSPASSR